MHAQSFEAGDVGSEGRIDGSRVGGEDVAPNVVGAEGEARKIGGSGTCYFFGSRLFGDDASQGRGEQLRQVRDQRYEAIVFGGI